MNRLTFKENGKWILKQDDNITRAREREELAQQAIDRLAEYEDMEEQGLLVRLPCKVGDVVYGIHQEHTILPMVVKWIETNVGWTFAAQYTPMAPKFYRFADVGQTVFLTREEAEKALEGNNG